jgi:peptidoglycan hydrolase-like protein with peptidoglycan-binding domain
MKELQEALNTLTNGNLKVDGLVGQQTQNAINKLRGQIERIFKRRGYSFNNSNLVAIRMDDVFDNKFTDICFVNIGTQNYAFNISTLAGLYGKGNVFNPNWIDGVFGVGVVKEGNYQKAYQLNTGWWTGLPFLFQIADFEYYRDGNLDITLNRAKVYKGKKGFNFHSWKGFVGNVVNNLSQGCMVAQQPIYESLAIPLFRELSKEYKNQIDFTLLQKRDFAL